MTDSSGDFDSVLDNIEKRGWGGDDGNDAAAALDAFIKLAPEEQERRLEELRPFQSAPPLPQNHVNLAICASAAMVDAVAPPVPEEEADLFTPPTSGEFTKRHIVRAGMPNLDGISPKEGRRIARKGAVSKRGRTKAKGERSPSSPSRRSVFFLGGDSPQTHIHAYMMQEYLQD